MKKRFVSTLVLLLVALISIWYYFSPLQKDSAIELIENDYMKNSLIHAYDRPNTQILSESLGQYMQYLLLKGDADRFEGQVKVLKSHFLKVQGPDTFVKWELGNQTTTNALIDDLRISETLIQAGHQFNEPAYTQLANQIETTLLKHQFLNGQWVDFYDWRYKEATSVLHLNYLDYEPLKRLQLLQPTKDLLKNAPQVGPFTPELYFSKKNEFKWANEKTVNMIDQVLIARLKFSLTGRIDSDFNRFITEELQEGKIYAHYNRSSKIPSTKHESSSVYALLLPIVSSSEQSIILKRLNSIHTVNPSSVHVFDVLNKAIETH